MHHFKLKRFPSVRLSIITTVILLFGITVNGFSQIKIGDNPTVLDSNSLLELEHNNKGVLIPRLSISDLSTADPLTAPIPEGMLVYNIDGTTENGFYFWDGTSWNILLTNSNINTRDNQVLVKSESDLPSPSAGVITLQSGVLYEINGSITLTNQIDLNGSYIEGEDVNNDQLIYTGSSGALFTGTAGGTVKVMTLSAPNAGARIFDIDNSSSGTDNFIMRDAIVANSADIGVLTGFNMVFLSAISFSGNQSGFTFNSVTTLLLENMAWFGNNSNIFESYVGSFGSIQKLGGFSQAMSANTATAIDVTGLTSLNSGTLKTVDFSGDGTRIAGSFSKEWEVESAGIATEKDDVAGGNIYITSASSTTISTVSTPVKIDGPTTTANLFRFTAPVSNRMVYEGTKNRNFQVMAALSVTSPSNNKTYKFYVAKNGSVLPESAQSLKISSGSDVGALAISGVVNLSTGDYVEVWVENISDNTNISVENMNLTVR